MVNISVFYFAIVLVSSTQQLNCAANVSVAVLIPSTTHGLNSFSLYNFALLRVSVFSFLQTIDRCVLYKLYIGVDESDMLSNFADTLEYISKYINVVVGKGGSFTKTVNKLADIAYRENNTYFVRINDDTFFLSKNWTTAGIKTLANFVPSNVGVVGPTCGQGNTKILTHDMVHRNHLDIFGYYYPPEFENWWADDWITKVYPRGNSKKISSWKVQHKMVHGTRYRVNKASSKRLTKLPIDQLVLEKYISQIKQKKQ